MDTGLLIEGINNKDIRVWEEFYANYYASLCSYCNNIINDGDQSEDIVQEVLESIWKSSIRFPGVKELTYYIYRACYNNALAYLRTRNIHSELIRKMDIEKYEDPEKMFAMTVREELIRMLYLHIGELPEGSREIMELSIKGMSGPEIASKLGISINTVKTQKSRGFKFLREKLKDSVLLFLF